MADTSLLICLWLSQVKWQALGVFVPSWNDFLSPKTLRGEGKSPKAKTPNTPNLTALMFSDNFK